MATLVYTAGAAESNKLIAVAALNTKFADVSTFLNTTKINDDNIQDAGISGTKIKAATITAAKLDATTEVITSQFADGSVTRAKRITADQDLSASTGSFSTSSTTYATALLGWSIAVRAGRPMLICLRGGTVEAVTVDGAIMFYEVITAATLAEYDVDSSAGKVPGAAYSFIYYSATNVNLNVMLLAKTTGVGSMDLTDCYMAAQELL